MDHYIIMNISKALSMSYYCISIRDGHQGSFENLYNTMKRAILANVQLI